MSKHAQGGQIGVLETSIQHLAATTLVPTVSASEWEWKGQGLARQDTCAELVFPASFPSLLKPLPGSWKVRWGGAA